jgi:hypothetical protein
MVFKSSLVRLRHLSHSSKYRPAQVLIKVRLLIGKYISFKRGERKQPDHEIAANIGEFVSCRRM